MSKFVTLREAENIAKKKLYKGCFDWLNSGAEDNFTSNLNIKDFNLFKLIPRVLTKNYKISIKAKAFGHNLRSPIILSPMGHQTQFHKFGEIETAKGISSYGNVGTFSTQSRMDLFDIRKKNKECKLIWQIFLFGDKNWILNEIKRAEKNKCIAIALCLDGPIRSFRYDDRETRYDARKFGKRTLKQSANIQFATTYGWEILRWIRRNTNLPVIIKGILSIDDFFLANNNNNIDGIWISNHGGRMLNSGISSLNFLFQISKFKKKKVIIFDGGVRKGSDILKCLCLGADLVAIGRPVIYGLVCEGYMGVKKIFNILEEELISCMINGGFKNLKSMNKNRIQN